MSLSDPKQPSQRIPAAVSSNCKIPVSICVAGDSLDERTVRSRRHVTISPYRPDIDGLRAIAVISVVLYHAGVPLLESGFVGVDVFFVISGFLIGGIVYGDARAGRFTFSRFYASRVRRIVPALLGVVIFTLLAGWRF